MLDQFCFPVCFWLAGFSYGVSRTRVCAHSCTHTRAVGICRGTNKRMTDSLIPASQTPRTAKEMYKWARETGKGGRKGTVFTPFTLDIYIKEIREVFPHSSE